MTWPPSTDTVQLLSLPLEIVGLFFAALEIYRPKHARALEAIFDFLGEGIFHLILGKQYRDTIAKQGVFAFILGQIVLLAVSTAACYYLWNYFRSSGFSPTALVTIALLCSAIVGVILGLGRGGSIVKVVFTVLGVVLYSPMYVVGLAVMIVLKPVEWLFALFNWMTNGYATGGLGLSFTMVGLLGEAYQVSAIDINTEYEWLYWGGVLAFVFSLAMLYVISRWVVLGSKGTDLSGFNDFVRKHLGLPPKD